ncbi:Stress response protein NST1 [Nakaseomyces bracarensis]|uniref:Stress response protein NST1 n=1 Tax=Nakaseomyces bracarensis TaxID=273131 RepID=A0ABR4NXU6_9SACH
MPPGSKSRKKKSKSKNSKGHTHVDKHPIEAEIVDEEDEDDYPTSRVIKRAPNGDVIVESLPENGKGTKKSKKKIKGADSMELDASKEIGLTLDSHWESLSPEEKKSILRIEKEQVLEVIRSYQNDHNCSCSVCGRRHMAMNQEMERIYNILYELEEQKDSDTNPIKFHLGIIKELQISKNQQISNKAIGGDLPEDNNDQVVKNFLASDVADKLKAEVQQFKQKQISKQETIKKTAKGEHQSTANLPHEETEINDTRINEVQKKLEQLSTMSNYDSNIEVAVEGENDPKLSQVKNEYMKFTESYISTHPKLAQKFVEKVIQYPSIRALTDQLMVNSSYELLHALKNLWVPNRLKIVEPNAESGYMNINKTLDPKEFTTMLHNGNPLSEQDYRDLQGAISRKVVNGYNFQTKEFENLSALEVELFGRFMCKDESNYFHDLIITAFNERLKETTPTTLQNTPEQMLAVASPATLDDTFPDDSNAEEMYTSDEYDDEEDGDYYDIKDEEYDSEYDDLDKEDILSDYEDHPVIDSEHNMTEDVLHGKQHQLRIPKDEDEVILESANGKIQSVENAHLDIGDDYPEHNHNLVTDELEHGESLDEEYESSIDDMERLEEGRKLIQIAITKLLQGRIMESYHEKEADNNRLKLLRELEEEQAKKKEREEKKQKKREKEKEKRKLQQLAKEEEKRKKEEEEIRAKEEQERKEMERREAQRKKVEEAKRKKDEERKRKLEEQRKREEQQEKQRKLKEDQKRKREEEKKKKEEEEKKKIEEEKRRKEEEERLRKEEEMKLKEEENNRKIEELVLNSNKTPSPFNPAFNTISQSPFSSDFSAPTIDTEFKTVSGRKNSHVLGLTQVYSDNIATSPNQNSNSKEISDEIFNIINAATTSAKSLSRSPSTMQSLLEPAKNTSRAASISKENPVIGTTGSPFNQNEGSSLHRRLDNVPNFGLSSIPNGIDITSGINGNHTNPGITSWNSYHNLNNGLNMNANMPLSSNIPTQQMHQIPQLGSNNNEVKRDYLGDELSKLTSMLSSSNMNDTGFNRSNAGLFHSSLWNDHVPTNSHSLTNMGLKQPAPNDPVFLPTSDQMTHRSSIWDDFAGAPFSSSHGASEHAIPLLNTHHNKTDQVPMDSAFVNNSLWSSNNAVDLDTTEFGKNSVFSTNKFGSMPHNHTPMNVNYNIQDQQRKELSDNIKNLSSNENSNGYIPINSLYPSMTANKSNITSFLNNLMDLQEPLGYEVIKDQTGMVNGLQMNTSYQGIAGQHNPISTSLDNFNYNRSLSHQNIQLGATHIPNLEGNSNSANNIAMNIMSSTSPSHS